jgi:hypothetical protein
MDLDKTEARNDCAGEDQQFNSPTDQVRGVSNLETVKYCRVLPGNATNNLLRVLNLITIYLDFNSYNQSYSFHRFTSLKLHCRIFCPESSLGLH